MRAEIKAYRVRAAELRTEADNISPEAAPDGLITISYYAIYHASIAAIISANGTAPTKHGKVHRALAHLAESREGEVCAREIESAMNDAYEMRIRANYEPDARPEETRANAERIPALRDTVIAFCDRVIDSG